VALAGAIGVIWAIAPQHHLGFTQKFAYLPLLPCLAVVLVIALVEGLTRRFPSYRRLDPGRVLVRLSGLTAVLGLVAFAYWLFPEYAGTFYLPYWQFLRTIAPAACLVPFYFMWADTRFRDADDEYLAAGFLVLGRWRTTDWRLIRHLLLSWGVKGFFLPLMVVYLNQEVSALFDLLSKGEQGTWPVYDLLYHLSYGTDLLFCVVGYSASIRLFDSQIRSVEPTVFGWLVALVCYQPFYSVIGKYYLQYDGTIFWGGWLAPWPALRDVWGWAIIVLTVTYALCTVAFGLRFSNLTHRGIITAGPYRLTKHPAYLSKNLSWWLISVPFVSDLGWPVALRHCLCLGLLNLVYFARARTEERHLSRDPTYVAYALWMNEHGMLRFLGRLMPFLRYRP
jgi:protein-S-isoprenylcysteine O-methyltransferase Ste14